MSISDIHARSFNQFHHQDILTEREENEQRIEGNIDLTEKEMEEDDQDINHLQK